MAFHRHLKGIVYVTAELTGKPHTCYADYELMICYRSPQDWGPNIISQRRASSTTTGGPVSESGDWYDIVCGPVAAFWDQRCAMNDADQISFHTRKAAKLLTDLITIRMDSGSLRTGEIAMTPASQLNGDERLDRNEMIGRFWMEVRNRLKETYKRKDDQADLGIGRYRGEAERRGIGDAVYNQGVERTAEIVNGVIDNSLLRDRPS